MLLFTTPDFQQELRRLINITGGIVVFCLGLLHALQFFKTNLRVFINKTIEKYFKYIMDLKWPS
jgi:hypothetical protein